MDINFHTTMSLVLLGAGILGGVINYFLVHKKIEEFSQGYVVLKSIFLGIGAAALVPLFLNVIGSKLMPSDDSKSFNDINYYYIGGFGLLASISSKRFIEDLYSRVTQVEKEAKEAKVTANEAIKTSADLEDSQTEVDDTSSFTAAISSFIALDPQDQPKFEAIVASIVNTHYSWRTLGGISKDTGISHADLLPILDRMKKQGIVKTRLNRHGNEVYRLISKA